MGESKRKLPTLAPLAQPAPARLVTVRPGSWRATEQSSAQRGYGYRWQKARAAYLEAHPFCAYCMREAAIRTSAIDGVILECAERGLAVPYASVVDHIIPHRGDRRLFWDRSNWQSLCATHHSRDKQREERGG